MLRHVIGYYTAAASASRTNAAVGGEVPMQELRRALILLAKRNEWMAARMERAAADPGSQKMLDGCAQAIFSMLTEYRRSHLSSWSWERPVVVECQSKWERSIAYAIGEACGLAVTQYARDEYAAGLRKLRPNILRELEEHGVVHWKCKAGCEFCTWAGDLDELDLHMRCRACRHHLANPWTSKCAGVKFWYMPLKHDDQGRAPKRYPCARYCNTDRWPHFA
jgi:hypothetical protein